jgi:hypothetical protein
MAVDAHDFTLVDFLPQGRQRQPTPGEPAHISPLLEEMVELEHLRIRLAAVHT